MIRRILPGVAAVMIAAAVHAQAASPAPAPASGMAAEKPAKAPKRLRVLTPADIDPTRLLPPPPVDGSEAWKADDAEVHRIIAARTPARLAQAKFDDDHEDPTAFAALLGPRFDLKALPATAEVLSAVQNDTGIAASAAKALFQRKRPWAADASIPTCDPGDKPNSSYPSGHATMGYSVGMTLAALIPEKAQAILMRAQDYAYSRAVCGSHYPSDTQASEVLSAAAVTAMMKDAAFRAKLDAARAELQSAGLASR